MRRKKANRVISPVIAQALCLQERIVDELVDGHQLQRGDPQVFQILHHTGVGEACICAADLRGDLLIEVSHTAYMGFVDDAVMVSDLRMPVIAPVKKRIDDH